MTTSVVHRDERTAFVENASFRWACQVLSYGLLGLTAFRSFVWRESPWDLMALVVLGGVVPIAYQGYHRVLTSRSAVFMLVAAVAGALIAAVVVWMR